MISFSVLFLVCFLPVVVVGLEHESISAREHHVTQPQHKDSERQQRPELPEGASQDHHDDRDGEEPQCCLVTV